LPPIGAPASAPNMSAPSFAAAVPHPAAEAPDGRSTARSVARQVADHPVLRTGGQAEVDLNPRELGPLRVTVEGTEGALRLVIEAARPETADLLRRHAETLRQELRQEGLGSVGVSIGGGGEGRRQEGAPSGRRWDGAPGPGPAAWGAAPPPPRPAPPASSRTAGGHIDLRF
jgi:flagellar hook-length control protein FliK